MDSFESTPNSRRPTPSSRLSTDLVDFFLLRRARIVNRKLRRRNGSRSSRTRTTLLLRMDRELEDPRSRGSRRLSTPTRRATRTSESSRPSILVLSSSSTVNADSRFVSHFLPAPRWTKPLPRRSFDLSSLLSFVQPRFIPELSSTRRTDLSFSRLSLSLHRNNSKTTPNTSLESRRSPFSRTA